MKHISLSILAASLLLATAVPAMASPVVGNITIGGTFVPTLGGVDSTNLATATGFDFGPPGPGGTMIVTGDGSLAGFFGAIGAITDFTFSPFSPIANFYSVSVAGSTLSFDLDTTAVADQTSTFLSLTGTGDINLTGYDQTAGIINLTATLSGDDPSVIFGFVAGSNSVNTVPEPSSAAIMGLGLLALAGLFGVRRSTQA